MEKTSVSQNRFIRSFYSVVLVLFLCVSNPLSGFAASSSDSVARLIIQFAPGDTIVREVHFSTTSITGLQAIQQAGLAIVTKDFGGGFIAVCSINGIGMPADNCFGDSLGRSWGYLYWDGAAWQSYMVGASGSSLSNGAVDGWVWEVYGGPNPPSATPLLHAMQGLDWLRTQQNGTTGGFSDASETLLALGSNRENLSAWRLAQGDPTLASYLMANEVTTAAKGADNAGKMATGLHASGGCWIVTAKKPSSYYVPATGAYGPGSYGAGHQAWAILGDKAFGETVPALAVTYLKSLVKSNGGWEWDAGFGTDSNTTALVIQALIATGEAPASTLIVNALNYLKTAQNTDGGFTYDPSSAYGTDSDTNSTSYSIMAILSVGQDPATWTKGSNTPMLYLLTQQHANGSFQYQGAYPADNLLATNQAITALLGKFYPLPGNSLKQCATNYLPVISR